jgi:tetratricopeptide (TPR) repeat protein
MHALIHNRKLVFGLILITAFMAYVPTFDAGFVWDDDAYVEQNMLLRDGAGLRRMWLDPMSIPQWYPVVHTTFWAEYQLYGLHPLGYHLVNVLLHLLSVWLLLLVLTELAVPGRLFAVALFACHPVMVESVAWVTERKNVLSLAFYLGSLLAYLRFWPIQESEGRGARHSAASSWLFYALALVSFAMALLSKSVTCSLPAAILLLIYWKKGRIQLADVLPVLPFFVIGLAAGLHTSHLEKVHVGAAGAEWEMGLIESSLVAGRSLIFYASKLVWPDELVFNYPRFVIDSGVWWQYLFPIGALAAIVSAFLWREKIGRGVFVGLSLFAGTLFPALGFIAVYPFRYSFVADHFQYHASLGILVLVAAAARSFTARLSRETLTFAVACLVVLALASMTSVACRKYENRETLYRSILTDHEASWFAHNNLGSELIVQGPEKERESLQHYQRAKAIKPDLISGDGFDLASYVEKVPPEAFAYAKAGGGLAVAFQDDVNSLERGARLGGEQVQHDDMKRVRPRIGQAVRLRECEKELHPKYWEASMNRTDLQAFACAKVGGVAAVAFRDDADSLVGAARLGDKQAQQEYVKRVLPRGEQALRLLDRAIELYPRYWEAWMNRSGLLWIMGLRASSPELGREAMRRALYGFRHVAARQAGNVEAHGRARALALTREPVVQILPRQVVGGDAGAFTFRVLNAGVVNVVDFEITGEYFVATNTKALIQPIGRATINPDGTLGALRAGAEETFDINFSHLVEQISDVDKGPTKILKLSAAYRREIDSTEFSTSRLYWITGNGDSLTEFDALSTASNNIMLTERIKSILQ